LQNFLTFINDIGWIHSPKYFVPQFVAYIVLVVWYIDIFCTTYIFV